MRYVHDCKSCKPVGEFGIYDLYVCENHPNHKCFIARYSDDAADYTSNTDYDKKMETKVRNELSGLNDNEINVLTACRLLPLIILNMAIIENEIKVD